MAPTTSPNPFDCPNPNTASDTLDALEPAALEWFVFIVVVVVVVVVVVGVVVGVGEMIGPTPAEELIDDAPETNEGGSKTLVPVVVPVPRLIEWTP
jgi:hypothetical protein